MSKVTELKTYRASDINPRLLRETWEAIHRGLTPERRGVLDAWHMRIAGLAMEIDVDLGPGGEVLPSTRRQIERLRKLIDGVPWMGGPS